MKVDKEFLLKHRFWIALGAYALLWLLLLIMLPVMVGSSAAAAKKTYDDATASVKKINSPPGPNGKKGDFANDAWIAPLKDKEGELKKRKEVVWKAAWDTQKDLMTWPADPKGTFHLDRDLKDAYFLDPIPDPAARKRYADTLYLPQFAEFKDAIAPAYYNGDYMTLLRPVQWPA